MTCEQFRALCESIVARGLASGDFHIENVMTASELAAAAKHSIECPTCWDEFDRKVEEESKGMDPLFLAEADRSGKILADKLNRQKFRDKEL